MALADIQRKIAALVEESRTIAAKADLLDADLVRIEEIGAEGGRFQKQMDALKKAGEFATWAGDSAGMLSLTGGQSGGATAVGMRAAGATEMTVGGRKSVLLNQDGEGILSEREMRLLQNPEYSKAFKSYLRVGLGGMTESRGLKVLQEGSDPAGGFLVPEDLLNRIIAKEPAPTRVAARLQQFTTSRDALVMPKVNYTTDNTYTTGMRVTWTGEVPASATTSRVTDPVFGQTRIPIYTSMMSLPLTNDLIEDTAFDLLGWCTGKFSETIVLLRENMALNGTGVGQPYGVLTAPGADNDQPGVTVSGDASNVTWEGLQNILWAVPEQYEDGCTWTFNKISTGLAIAKLLDGDGRPLWTNGAQDHGMVGSPKQRELLGYEVIYSALMPSVAASAYPYIFGDLKGYYSVDRVGMSIQVLRELYAETNQILLLGRVRMGGVVAEPWRMRIGQISA